MANDLERLGACPFSVEQIAEFTRTAKLPLGTDLAVLRSAVNATVVNYLRDRLPDGGIPQPWYEVDALYRAADKHQYPKLADLLERPSETTKRSLNRRGEMFRPLPLALPAPSDLRGEPQTAKEAAYAIKRLCVVGESCREGRKDRKRKGRKDPKRKDGTPACTVTPARTVVVELHAPKPYLDPPRREQERALVLGLQLAVLVATGTPPAATAHFYRPGPFVRFVDEVLGGVRAQGVKIHLNVVEAINAIDRGRSLRRRRLPD